MFCPKHPKLEMTESGRMSAGRGGRMIHECPLCVAVIRAKLAPLRGEKGWKHGRTNRKQCVLPPVMMPERWP